MTAVSEKTPRVGLKHILSKLHEKKKRVTEVWKKSRKTGLGKARKV